MGLFDRHKKTAEAVHAPAEQNEPEQVKNGGAALGDADYLEGLRLFYSKHESEAADTLRLAAELGNAKAQHFLAMMYANGTGVEQDDEKAAYWYHQTAERGDSEAQLTYAMLCALGKGVESDLAAACHWARQALHAGNKKALRTLGVIRDKAREEAVGELRAAMEAHAAQQRAEAVRHLERAAELGSADAQYAYAQMLETGRDVEQNEQAAALWYAEAASQGHEKAVRHLAEAPQEEQA